MEKYTTNTIKDVTNRAGRFGIIFNNKSKP